MGNNEGKEPVMDRLTYYIIAGIVGFVIRWIWYFIDADREKRGLPSKHREYLDNGDNPMQFVNHYIPDDAKVTENEDGSIDIDNTASVMAQQRRNYNFGSAPAEMDTIEAIGEMPPKNSNSDIE